MSIAIKKEGEKMYIHEAVKKALEENKCITILTECENIAFKIKPTNNPEENCKLIYADGTPAPKIYVLYLMAGNQTLID